MQGSVNSIENLSRVTNGRVAERRWWHSREVGTLLARSEFYVIIGHTLSPVRVGMYEYYMGHWPMISLAMGLATRG